MHTALASNLNTSKLTFRLTLLAEVQGGADRTTSDRKRMRIYAAVVQPHLGSYACYDRLTFVYTHL